MCDRIELLIHSQERASCCCLVVAESHKKVTETSIKIISNETVSRGGGAKCHKQGY